MKQLTKINIEYLKTNLQYNAAVFAINQIHHDIWRTHLIKKQMEINATIPFPDHYTNEQIEPLLTERMVEMYSFIVRMMADDKQLLKFWEIYKQHHDVRFSQLQSLIKRQELIISAATNWQEDFKQFEQINR